ncbi:xanthine dehydrogenase family protein subunit M [Haloechinothrix sp. YIM 98757]|uniref:Xanthine dehydrogenase family protein subunit M n=1 Tax=Haloechinothrix aidingensis TaxID=2752311 RepID=A0A838AEC0_9PSEU|nr:xanthine dehydrogenase family protein subunit M [Haloechinothrix aidingensis]MBA0127583.1 xanthine dehydrogenase family protein subunit M [Haloechinothrix aidingensis]
MLLPPLRYLRPETPGDAAALLSEMDGSVVLAGGQTLLNMLKLDLARPAALVDVHRISALRDIRHREDGTLIIGAAVTYSALAGSSETRRTHPAVADMAASLVDRQVRNRGTIGGNCCLNDPANNFPPLLAALDARFRVLGTDGERVLRADEFFVGTLATGLRRGELLVAVEVPAMPPGSVVAHEHLQVGADSWAIARAVVRLDRDGTGGTGEGFVTDARAVLGAVYGSPLRLHSVERSLSSARVSPGLADAATALREVDVRPTEDVHCSTAYRLEMAEVQLRRALRAAVEGSIR